MIIFGAGYGYLMKVPFPAIGMMLASVVSVIGFAFYLKFKPSTLAWTNRASWLFVGASVIGFCIWAAMALSLNATGLLIEIDGVVGEEFFAITSLIIFLVAGAFIGDWISNNKQRFKFRKS
jgi:NO-binding membrane sensor protein with MHYT domain